MYPTFGGSGPTRPNTSKLDIPISKHKISKHKISTPNTTSQDHNTTQQVATTSHHYEIGVTGWRSHIHVPGMAQGKYGIYGVHGIYTPQPTSYTTTPLATTTPLSTWTCYTTSLPLTGNGTVVVIATTRARGYYRDHGRRGRRGKENGY